jgi:hypothetical protein
MNEESPAPKTDHLKKVEKVERVEWVERVDGTSETT